MRYRQQESLAEFSQIKGALPRLMDSSLSEVRERTYRTYRTISRAYRALERLDAKGKEPKLSKVQFGSDERDVRYVINYFGSNPRPRHVKLAPKKVYFLSHCTALAPLSLSPKV